MELNICQADRFGAVSFPLLVVGDFVFALRLVDVVSALDGDRPFRDTDICVVHRG